MNEAIHEASGNKSQFWRWNPYPDRNGVPHPQRMALESRADLLGYGGEAGGGKTDLLLGVAERHRKSIIFRRTYPVLSDIVERSRELFSETQPRGYNDQLHRWSFTDGRIIKLASMQYEKDRENYRGRAHDFYGFDELPEFSESQFRFVTAWNRSTYVNPKTGKLQRCRTVVTFNPPADPIEDWVTRLFLPWLAYLHPKVFTYTNPAVPGELRWFIRKDDKDVEVNESDLSWYLELGEKTEKIDHYETRTIGDIVVGPQRGIEIDGEIKFAKSRTFIPASLRDNPKLLFSGYSSTLDALPEPIRSLLMGFYGAGRVEDARKVIPYAWVLAAQERGKMHKRPTNALLLAVGIDPARGGKANTVFSQFWERWVEFDVYPGTSTPDGESIAVLAESYEKPGVGFFIDVIGIGSSGYDIMQMSGLDVTAVNFAEGAPNYLTDKSGRLKFRNVRAAAYWLFREALDPKSGDNLYLPDDPRLVEELCEPKWRITTGGILIEDKDDISERIGRSPDIADAIVIAHYGIKSMGTAGI